MQGHDAVATRYALKHLLVVAVDVVGRVIPGVLVAGDDRGIAVERLVNRQVQCND